MSGSKMFGVSVYVISFKHKVMDWDYAQYLEYCTIKYKKMNKSKKKKKFKKIVKKLGECTVQFYLAIALVLNLSGPYLSLFDCQGRFF